MEFVNFMIWTQICVCLPLTTLAIFWVCCAVRRERVPVIYHTNLLISNLMQLSMISFWKFKQDLFSVITVIIGIICMVGLMANLYFRMFIAIERCFVIARPQSNWIRQTGRSMLVSVLVWILCVITVSLCLFHDNITISVLSLLPGPLFIFFSAWAFKALPAATSVPADEKRRIVGTLVLLLINYFLMILPGIICVTVSAVSSNMFSSVIMYVAVVSVFLSPFADLILVFFMRKGPIDKLLSCLCCCITDDSAGDVAGHQQLHEYKELV